MKPANRARHRRHLVEAATAIVARDGLAGLTFRSAADEVGTTTAPFTYAFGTKDDLLLAVARHAWESVWGPIDDPASSAEGQADAVERLRLLLERSVPLMQPAPIGLRAYAEIFFQNLRDPSLRPILAESSEWSRLLRRRHVALLRAAQKDGAIDRRHDPNHLVWPFYQLVGGLLVESLYYPDHLPPKLLPRLWERGFSALVASRPTAANSPIAVHAANPTGNRVDDPHMESLIDAALEVVARDGLSGLTFRATARELGTTTAPFTYAFGSKSAMLEALGERVFFDVWPLETPPMDATPLDRLRLRYERALPLHRPVRSELRAYAELFFQNLRNPELARTRATSVGWSKTINRDLARLVDDARDAGEITGEGRASDLLILLDAIAGGLLIVGLHYPRYLPAARLRANWATIFAALTGSDSG